MKAVEVIKLSLLDLDNVRRLQFVFLASLISFYLSLTTFLAKLKASNTMRTM